MTSFLDRIEAVLDGLPGDATAHDVYDALSDFDQADVDAVLATRSLSAGGGSLAPPVTLTGIDPDEAVLTLRADDAQTEHIFRAYDVNGDLAVDIDFEGIFDVRAFNVQDPPDTGAPAGGSASQVLPARWLINSGNDTSDDPMKITKWDAGIAGYRTRLTVKYWDAGIVELNPIENEVAVTFIAPSTPNGNAIEMWDSQFNNLLFAVTHTGGVIFPSSDPLVAGAWWDNAGTLARSAG